MKFTLSLSLLVAVAAVAGVDAQPEEQQQQQLLRGNNEAAEESSPCNDKTSKDACKDTTDVETGNSCVWCECSAIPSECLSKSQADKVPPGVFDCDNDDSDATSASSNVFEFVPNFLHSLTEQEVQDDLCDASSKSLSGYMEVKGSKYDEEGEDKHLFYWMFEKRPSTSSEDADKDIPFMIWLTGGPGCSSTLALLTENGPCHVNEDGESTTVNPYSWTEAAHVLWLDQPAGVGYSYGSETDKNEDMISEDGYYFLQAFFQAHPEYANSPLYIVGESYGGHYAPAIAHRVWLGNQDLKKNTIHLNLAGVGVGNGLTDPEEQYKWYPEMVYNNSHHIKVVDEETYNTMKKIAPKCTYLIHQCNEGDSMVNAFACQSAFAVCNMGLTAPYQMTGLNPYDIRKQCDVRPLCYDFSMVDKFLNLQSTRDALGVTKESGGWQSCNMGINLKFHVDWMKDFSPYVADMLNDGIRVLIYAGDVDFICNYLGNRAWTLGLEWDHSSEFLAADDHDWNDGKGLARSSNGFTFLQVYDAGHMVPADQPKVSLDMITTFVNDGDF